MRKIGRGNVSGVRLDDVEFHAARRELYAAEEALDRLEIAGGVSPGRVRDGAGDVESAATQRVRRAWKDYRTAIRRRRSP
jgi:hypothetical protein